jgi:cytochrome P450
VLHETLRLYPPTWALVTRVALKAVELGGYVIPPGGCVSLAPFVTQRDPRFFPDPECFDPERFAPGWQTRIPAYAYFPFGAGPHVCIGSAFALAEMTLVLATVLQHYRFALEPGQAEAVPEPLLAIRPRGGLRLRVSRCHA